MNRSLALGAISAASIAASAQAQTLLAVGNDTFGTPSLLVEIDAQTASVLRVTPMSNLIDNIGRFTTLKSLETSPDGTVYGFTQTPQSQMYTVDVETGLVETQGDDFLVPVFEGGIAMIDNDFAYVSNGFTASENYLLRVNLETSFDEIVTLLEEPIDLSALNLRSDGAVIGVDTRNLEYPRRIVEIDPADGSITPIADLASTRAAVSAGMVIVDGVGYYVISNFAPARNSELWSFDPFTGVQTRVGSIAVDAELSGLALRPEIGCVEDVDGDGAVGLSDLLTVLSVFGQPVGSGDPVDVVSDGQSAGVVDLEDLLAVLGAFGVACP